MVMSIYNKCLHYHLKYDTIKISKNIILVYYSVVWLVISALSVLASMG